MKCFQRRVTNAGQPRVVQVDTTPQRQEQESLSQPPGLARLPVPFREARSRGTREVGRSHQTGSGASCGLVAIPDLFQVYTFFTRESWNPTSDHMPAFTQLCHTVTKMIERLIFIPKDSRNNCTSNHYGTSVMLAHAPAVITYKGAHVMAMATD